jgi:transposase
MLHSSVVAHILVQKVSLGLPHYRLEQHLQDQGLELGRSTMCRYVEEAGNALGATVVHAMWQDAIGNRAIISTDATSALIQPEEAEGKQHESRKKRPRHPLAVPHAAAARSTRRVGPKCCSPNSRPGCAT